jgi:hypothetical protein
LNPLDYPRNGQLGMQIWWLSLLRLVLFFFFPLSSLLKVEAWGEGKETPVLKGAVRTDLSTAEEDPRLGRPLEPVQGWAPRARTERSGAARRQLISQVFPPSAGPAPPRPPPPLAPRSPPHRRGPGNPPARFFVQFQQSSEEVGPFVPLFIDCVNIAKRRRRSGGPR